MSPAPLVLGSHTLTWQKPLLMGVLNLTPDSFSDGGTCSSVQDALNKATQLVEQGADILDIGGESTRPGSHPVDAHTELARIVPFLKALQKKPLPCLLSVDTYKAQVAHACLSEGAHIINDISCGQDPLMAQTLAQHKAAWVLMHKKGVPRTMQQGLLHYTNLFDEVRTTLETAVAHALSTGIPKSHLWVDPGIGFGKTTAHNLALTTHLQECLPKEHAVVYGASRKNFLGEITGQPVHARDIATQAVLTTAVLQGAHVLRVHDVAMAYQTVQVACALKNHLG
jgi:dihydropteroate synthase